MVPYKVCVIGATRIFNMAARSR